MKKTITQIAFIALLTLLLAGLMAGKAQAAEIVDSGTCGNNVTWTLDNAGKLTISGTGSIAGGSSIGPGPWGDSVKAAIIEDGITRIGSRAFWTCDSLTSVTIPESVTDIGQFAFSGCSSLKSVTIDRKSVV